MIENIDNSFLEKYTILNNIFKDYCKNCKNIQKSIESNALLCAKLDIINYKKNIILKTTINNNDIHIIQLFNDKYTRYKTALYNGNNTYIELYHKFDYKDETASDKIDVIDINYASRNYHRNSPEFKEDIKILQKLLGIEKLNPITKN